MCICAGAALGRRISKALTFLLAFARPPALRVAKVTWGISAPSLLINLKASGLVSGIPAAHSARRCQGLMHQACAFCTAAHGDLGLGGHLSGDRKAGPLPPSGTWIPELPACSSPATMGVPDGGSQAPSGAAPPVPGAVLRLPGSLAIPCAWFSPSPLCPARDSSGEAAAGARPPHAAAAASLPPAAC